MVKGKAIVDTEEAMALQQEILQDYTDAKVSPRLRF
jgi:hypothetical protein